MIFKAVGALSLIFLLQNCFNEPVSSVQALNPVVISDPYQKNDACIDSRLVHNSNAYQYPSIDTRTNRSKRATNSPGELIWSIILFYIRAIIWTTRAPIRYIRWLWNIYLKYVA